MDIHTGYGYGGSTNNDYGSSSPAPQRVGGNGGLGSDPLVDATRAALFGNASACSAPPPLHDYQAQQQMDQGIGGGGNSAAQPHQGYGRYDDRQLTEEEQAEEDIQATASEIRFLKQSDVSATRNALRLAQQAEQTSRDTLSRLGDQGERIHNAERHLDGAAVQNRLAEEKLRELQTLNRSMFAVHVKNPFTSASRQEARDGRLLATHQRERADRDASRAEAWASHGRREQVNAQRGGPSEPASRDLATRTKYQFEADSEDDAMEDEIDSNLDALHTATSGLKHLARAIGDEVHAGNKQLDRTIQDTDRVEDQIAVNRARLGRIR